MREPVKIELSHLRERRPWWDGIVLRLARPAITRFVSAHLSQAYQTSVIGSKAMHDLDAWMKGDLGLPGYLKEIK